MRKKDIEKALRSCGYSVRDSKKFIGRLPGRWFDKAGNMKGDVIEAEYDAKNSGYEAGYAAGYVERLLASI